MAKKVLVHKNLSVFSQPSTSSSKVGRVRVGGRYPFLGETQDARDEHTHWYNIEVDGKSGWIVESSWAQDYADLVKNEEERELTAEPPAPFGGVHWECFSQYLPYFENQTYSLKSGQLAFHPLGLEGWLTKSVGQDRINCSCFTVCLVPKAMDVPLTKEHYSWWQVWAGVERSTGYGPGAAATLGMGVKVEEPEKTLPKDGIYLVQHFKGRGGHSYLILDYDEAP